MIVTKEVVGAEVIDVVAEVVGVRDPVGGVGGPVGGVVPLAPTVKPVGGVPPTVAAKPVGGFIPVRIFVFVILELSRRGLTDSILLIGNLILLLIRRS